MNHLPALPAHQPDRFPPVTAAWSQPDGLLAVGGDLSVPRLLAAYRRGIFPWPIAGQPLLWWSPSMRTVFDTAAIHVPRRFARWLRRSTWTLSVNRQFDAVIAACSGPRQGENGTWITPAMRAAYLRLHDAGHAHSVEAWEGTTLAGGIYGVAIGRMFFGESMFSARSNGSRVALLALARLLSEHGLPLLDAQMPSPHLDSLGARQVSRAHFCRQVSLLAGQLPAGQPWRPRELAPAAGMAPAARPA